MIILNCSSYQAIDLSDLNLAIFKKEIAHSITLAALGRENMRPASLISFFCSHTVDRVTTGTGPLRALVHMSLLTFGLLLLSSSNSSAEDAGVIAWKTGGCSNCHGNLAAGGQDPSYPQGPNLRVTLLDKDQLIETISCGRPGTEMPANLKGAYATVPCYGLPTGEVPKEVRPGGGLTKDEIQALVTFLGAEVVGKKRITRQNCALFNEGNSSAPECMQF